jgi:hypothetical protein
MHVSIMSQSEYMILAMTSLLTAHWEAKSCSLPFSDVELLRETSTYSVQVT